MEDMMKLLENKKILALSLSGGLVLLLVLLAASPRTLSQRDVDLAQAICEPLDGLHNIVMGPLGIEAVTCKKRTEKKYTCLDRVISQDNLREVDSLRSCFFSNDASQEEIDKVTGSLATKEEKEKQ